MPGPGRTSKALPTNERATPTEIRTILWPCCSTQFVTLEMICKNAVGTNFSPPPLHAGVRQREAGILCRPPVGTRAIRIHAAELVAGL